MSYTHLGGVQHQFSWPNGAQLICAIESFGLGRLANAVHNGVKAFMKVPPLNYPLQVTVVLRCG